MVFGRNSTVGGDGLTNAQRYAKRMEERRAKEAAARAKREAAAKPKAPVFGKSQDKTSAAYKKILADRAAAKAAADKKAAQMAAARKAASDKKAADIKRQQDQAKRLAAKKAADAAAAKAAAAKAAAKPPVKQPPITGRDSLIGGDGLTNAERYAKRRAEAEAKAAAAAVRKATDSRGNANAFGTEWDVNSNRDNPYGVTSIKDSSGLGFSGNPEHFITSGNPADMQGIEVGYITDKEEAAKPPMPPAEPTKGQTSGVGMGGFGAFFNGIRNGTATNIKGNVPAGGTDASVTVDQSGAAGNPLGMFNSLAGVVNNVRNPNTPEPIKFTQAEIDAELATRAEEQAAADAAAQAAADAAAGQAQAELFNPTQEAGPVRNRNFQTVDYTQGGATAGVNTGIGVASQSQATPWADAYMRAQQASAKQGPISGLFSKEMENS